MKTQIGPLGNEELRGEGLILFEGKRVKMIWELDGSFDWEYKESRWKFMLKLGKEIDIRHRKLGYGLVGIIRLLEREEGIIRSGLNKRDWRLVSHECVEVTHEREV